MTAHKNAFYFLLFHLLVIPYSDDAVICS
uniref:Uncharacterized protein n=1 Tax=Rhizophora mucronata TaxID=61149 RepID=A0A2P2QJD0_RHIMU